MQHALAGRMIRQRLAAEWLAILALRALATLGIRLRPCRTFAVLRPPLFKLPKDGFQLLDLAVELLGGAAEPRPSQHRKLRLEMFDLKRLGIELGIADRNHAITSIRRASFSASNASFSAKARFSEATLWEGLDRARAIATTLTNPPTAR